MQHVDRILRTRDVVQAVGLSRMTLHTYEAAGKFPKRLVLATKADGTPQRVGWLESEVQAWIKARAAERAA